LNIFWQWRGIPPSIEFYIIAGGADGHVAPLHTFTLNHVSKGRTPMAVGAGTAIGVPRHIQPPLFRLLRPAVGGDRNDELVLEICSDFGGNAAPVPCRRRFGGDVKWRSI